MIPIRDDNPITLKPLVDRTIIGVCVVAFLWQFSLDPESGQRAVYALGAIPAVLLGEAQLPPELVWVPTHFTVLTSMFLHGGWMHLIGNMLYLWIFGDNIEDAMGHGRFAVFYILCGVAAVFAQALPSPDSQIPMIGASGAISGVLGAYLLLFPRAHVMVAIPMGFYIPMVRLPALAVLGFWFLIQLLYELVAPDGAGVAFRAHIGGFIAGMLLIPLFKRRDIPLWRPHR